MAEPVIEARGVRRGFLQGSLTREVLRGVDLAVRPGEFAAVLGPSGSGKSTLLNLLGLMDSPDAGEVLVLGRGASGAGASERAALRNRAVGFVFQFDSLLPEFTVLENAMMPGRLAGARGRQALSELEDRARELLGTLGILPLASRFPATLSGGERQRAAIARALVNRPGVVLADEPTGNLDRANGEAVFSHLRRLADELGVGVVLATHNEYVSRFATRSLHLIDGRLEAAPA
jgi:lipoprotein-releasing system ATP-binding protein